MARRRAEPGEVEPPSASRRKRLTLADIAAEAGVSAGLVSLVLSGRPGPSPATAERVVAVAERLGYRTNRTASQLARRRTRLLGVTMTPGNPYHGELVEEILSRTHDRGYEVVLAAVTRTHEERSAIETLVDSRCEAVVLLNSGLTPEDLGKVLEGLPAVCVGRPLDVDGIDVVRTADDVAVAALVRHLVELGHREIVHVDGGDSYLPAERRRGYIEAMKAHGLEAFVVPGGETEDDGRRAADVVLRRAGVTAVLAYNDLCAIGVMDQMQHRGIMVPDDVSVTGFDDGRIAGLARIALTTIDPSKLEQARLAVDLALARAEDDREETVVRLLEPRLVVRGSTAPPRAAPPRGR